MKAKQWFLWLLLLGVLAVAAWVASLVKRGHETQVLVAPFVDIGAEIGYHVPSIATHLPHLCQKLVVKWTTRRGTPRAIEVRHAVLTQSHANALKSLGAQLEEIHLAYVTVPDSLFQIIGTCKKLTDLTLANIRVAGTNGRYSDDSAAELEASKIVNAVTNLHGLVSLNISGNAILDSHITVLSGLTNLRILRLSKTRITDKALQVLSALPRIEELHMGWTRVTGDGIRSLKGLQELGLNNCQISDTGLRELSSLTNLVVLNLSDTVFAGQNILLLTNLVNLRHLYLKRATVSSDAIAELGKRLPNCIIDR